MFKLFLHLISLFLPKVHTESDQTYCRNWINVDEEFLPKLYTWIDNNTYLVDKEQCAKDCVFYQNETQKLFNASLISPFSAYEESFEELCTMKCITNEACINNR